MAAHSILDLVARYEAVGGSWSDIEAIPHVRGPRDDADCLGRNTEREVESFVEAAEAAHTRRVRAERSAATGTATFRQTKTGTWVAYGAADAIAAGQDVVVAKRDGEQVTRRVETVGRAFDVDGVAMIYGYLVEDEPHSAQGRWVARTSGLYGDGHYLSSEPGATYYSGRDGRSTVQIWDNA